MFDLSSPVLEIIRTFGGHTLATWEEILVVQKNIASLILTLIFVGEKTSGLSFAKGTCPDYVFGIKTEGIFSKILFAISSPVLLNSCPDMARVYNWEVKKRQALKAQTEK